MPCYGVTALESLQDQKGRGRWSVQAGPRGAREDWAREWGRRTQADVVKCEAGYVLDTFIYTSAK